MKRLRDLRERVRCDSHCLALALLLAGCASPAPPPAAPPPPAHGHHHAPVHTTSSDPVEASLDEVARIHGAPGPWAVAGYRMSEYAMKKLALERGSFDLQITHHTPPKVKYSCIADGAAAYSGASLGKLNLALVDAPEDDVLTEYRNKKTGQKVVLRPAPAFRTRYADTPRDKARELGREVLGLPAEQVFEEVPAS